MEQPIKRLSVKKIRKRDTPFFENSLGESPDLIFVLKESDVLRIDHSSSLGDFRVVAIAGGKDLAQFEAPGNPDELAASKQYR